MTSFFHTLAAHPTVPIFLLTNLLVGYWAHRKRVRSFEDYALASRSLPTGVLVLTLLGTFVASGDLWMIDDHFAYGVLHSIEPFFFLCSFFLIGTFIAPYLVYYDDSITQGDLMGIFYGRVGQFLTGLVGVVISLLVIGSQLKAIGSISAYILGVDARAAILFFGGMVVLYSVWGGMRAVSYTDVLQGICAILVFGWIAHVMVQKVGGMQMLIRKLPVEKKAFFGHPGFLMKVKGSIFWGLFPALTLTPPIIQRMLMSHDKRQVRKMWYTGASLYGLISFAVMLIGLCFIAGAVPLEKGLVSEILPRSILLLFEGERMVADLVFVALLGVLLSTADSYLHALSITFVQDIVGSARLFFKKRALSSRRKRLYARASVLTVGICAIALGLFGDIDVVSEVLYTYTVLASCLLLVPLLIGIVGVKTDKVSWGVFTTMYVGGFGTLKFIGGWHLFDQFLWVVPMATAAYFISHAIRNRGIVILKRSGLTIAEQLWLPSCCMGKKQVGALLNIPSYIVNMAGRKIIHTPTQPLAFSLLIFALYTGSSMLTGEGGVSLAHFIAGVHVIGIALCCGLMLEGLWPDWLRSYFALYWFITLFYCIPFGGTVAFLRMHTHPVHAALWVGKIVLFSFLVDTSSFLLLTCTGVGLALVGWKVVFGALPLRLLEGSNPAFLLCLLIVLVGILVFSRKKESYTEERMYWNRIASSSLGHDLRSTAQMLGGAGSVLESSFKASEMAKNSKGEFGYWLPKRQAAFLANFAEKMIARSAEAKQEISNFLKFIERQVMSTFEQEEVSMRTMVEEGMHRVEEALGGKVKLSISCKKDFYTKVIAGIFPHAIVNLLHNAATHGKASEIEVRVDGASRKVHVIDNGKGIPSDILPFIFDLNYSTDKCERKNAGIGLAFVEMVMRVSSGKVICRSRHGDKKSFTEFIMIFP